MVAAPETHHVAVLEVSARLLLDLLVEGERPAYRSVANPIPADARIVGANYDSVRRVFHLALEHPSFRAIPEGQPYPDLPPPEFVRVPD
jgi:hypothetical protein